MFLKKWRCGICRRRIYAGAFRRRRRLNQAAVEAEIERLIHDTGDRFSFVHDFREDLFLPLQHCMQYLSRRLRRIPGPVDMRPDIWDDAPALNAFFTSPRELADVLKASRSLKDYFRTSKATDAVAVFTAERKEKTIFGIEKTGEIVRRDVPQKAIYFEGHRVFCPAPDLTQSREHFRHKALQRIFDMVFDQIETLQADKAELEEQKQLLLFNYPEFGDSRSLPDETVAFYYTPGTGEVRALLTQLSRKIDAIEADVGSTGACFAFLAKVLNHPEAHLKLENRSLNLSRLGIRLDDASAEPGNAFELAEFELGNLPEHAAVWVRVSRTDVS